MTQTTSHRGNSKTGSSDYPYMPCRARREHHVVAGIPARPGIEAAASSRDADRLVRDLVRSLQGGPPDPEALTARILAHVQQIDAVGQRARADG